MRDNELYVKKIIYSPILLKYLETSERGIAYIINIKRISTNKIQLAFKNIK